MYEIIKKHLVFFLALTAFVFPVTALAYVGPGAGITLVGALLGLIAAILFVLVGILFWPLRLLWRKFNPPPATENDSNPPGSDQVD